MSPTHFEMMQDFLSNFKSLVLQLKKCGIEKKEEQLILSLISKLGPEYSVFFLTFHSGKLIVRNWRMPTLADFIESFTQEQEKLFQMGTIKSTKDQSLVLGVLNESEGKKNLRI